MPVVLSRRIKAAEFPNGISEDELSVIRRSSRTALSAPLAGKGLLPGTRLLKAYATSSRGPRRVVYLLAVSEGDLFLLFYRDKNDPVGANMSPQNPAFKSQLAKRLTWLREDIETGNYDVLKA